MRTVWLNLKVLVFHERPGTEDAQRFDSQCVSISAVHVRYGRAIGCFVSD